MRFKNSTYWKCQLIGWTLYAFIPIIFLLSSDGFTPIIFLLGNMGRKLIVESPVGIGANADLLNTYLLSIILKVILLGILISHVMRWFIIKLNILSLSFSRQILSFLILSFFFSLLFLLSLNLSVDASYFLMRLRQTLNVVLTQGIIFSGAFIIWNLIYFLYHFMKKIREEEQAKLTMKVQMLELEARALRAQMNPHFIFNCLNSIKSLIQDGQKDKSVTYLTTFSKLIRNLFNNADKKEISLYDEIETCKLYLQLEAMRLDSKFSYNVNIDETIDLKSIRIPALIIQPFIENAIWHGIVPKGNVGTVSLDVSKRNGDVEIIVDDNGIGRESSGQNKGASSISHQSKGVNLTQSRLELDNLLQQRKAKLETIDKRDENGKASGTKVIITLPQED